MKKLILLTILALSASASSQSVLTLGTGTSMGVATGANLCANIINGPGILYGGGSICGGLVAIDPVTANMPETFELMQNYPNPFNPSTVIRYQLPKSAYLIIKLYDQLGREAGVLYEGEQQTGYYQISVDGTSLSSGIYYCTFSVSGYSKTIKMLLIK